MPREGGGSRFVTKVWAVDATTGAILELADHLVALQIEKVVLESTSDYWRPSSRPGNECSSTCFTHGHPKVTRLASRHGLSPRCPHTGTPGSRTHTPLFPNPFLGSSSSGRSTHSIKE